MNNVMSKLKAQLNREGFFFIIEKHEDGMTNLYMKTPESERMGEKLDELSCDLHFDFVYDDKGWAVYPL